jgi:DNA-binding MarR family transcriptional regulator
MYVHIILIHIFAWSISAMKLEEEIKQLKFSNEFRKLGVNIIYTANWLTHHHAKQCKEHDITPEQFNILRILRGQHPKPATVNLLIERMLNKMSNASRLVEKLRKKGLVERLINKIDRRACDVRITKLGLHLLTELDKAEKEWDKLFSHLSVTEARQVSGILDKLRK